MARKAFIGMACIAIALGTVGCTWTSGYRDYPASINRDPAEAGLGGGGGGGLFSGHSHGHDHGHHHDAE